MKIYEEPRIEVLRIEVADIVTTSGDTEIENGGEWT